PDSQLSVLGATSETLEYKPGVDPRPRWTQDAAGLHLDVMMAQRLYNDRKWPNPIVLKMTKVSPGLKLPAVATETGERGAAGATLRGQLTSLGDAPAVEVSFQHRRKKGTEDLLKQEAPWVATKPQRLSAPGPFTASVSGLDPGVIYEFRAVVKHPIITLYGEEKPLAPVVGAN
ncbi:MAG TPA: alpha-L-fucosidase, partial [Polyangia bacterium]|nr:alpha-L-fucosidase [Polyangia bacterium]